jgi:hypothetical protein
MWFSLLVNVITVPTSQNLSILKFEAILSSEISVLTSSTLFHIPEEGILHNRLDNLKSSIACNFRQTKLRTVIKSNTTRWAGHVARTGEKKKAYVILVGETRKMSAGKSR